MDVPSLTNLCSLGPGIIVFAVHSFAEDRIGWKEDKVNELLLPVLKKLNTATSTGQAKLTDFFSSGAGVSSASGTLPTSQPLQGRGRATIRSKRLRCAITRIKGICKPKLYNSYI